MGLGIVERDNETGFCRKNDMGVNCAVAAVASGDAITGPFVPAGAVGEVLHGDL